MHAVVRNYSGRGAKELFTLLEQKKSEVESLLRKVKGFVGYTLLKSTDGGISITVCQDKSGADESSNVARDWVRKNASHLNVATPAMTEGSVILYLK